MKFTLLYSKKETEKDTIYLRHRFSLQGKASEVKIKTNFKINRFDWDNNNECWDHSKKIKSPRKEEDKLLNNEIDHFNVQFGLLKKKVQDFLNENPYPKKEDLSNLLFGEKINTAVARTSEFPVLFSDFVDFYIEEKSKLIHGKQKPISTRTEQRYRQIKEKVNRFYPNLKITDIDDDFRDNYSLFMNKLNYKPSFIIKELKFIKTFCKFANRKIDVNKEVLYWSFIDTDENKFLDPIFSFDEIELLKNAKLEREALKNARDWLVISCYTGQRVSDLLQMTSDNIVQNEFYTVHQQKGQKDVTIWLFPEVLEIINRNGGEFPRRISAAKYNEYIKTVAEKAKIYQIIKGGKQEDNRKVIKEYPKWQLVTSHIGRRTFVSLFEPIVGKELIKTQTGHVTDAMVNLYNKTAAIDKAKIFKDAYIKAKDL